VENGQVNINGVELRADYGDPFGEARACRDDCALFDFSFIATARVSGIRAGEAVENFASRSLTMLDNGRIAYALRVNGEGHALSDLTIWKNGPDSFDVMSGRSQDIETLLGMQDEDLQVSDITLDSVVMALQGPASFDVLDSLGVAAEIRALKYFSFADSYIAGIPCRIGRLGYTGEAGFELIVAQEYARKLWRLLAEAARPAGFIAADALRIEAGFVLFTNEFRLRVSPAEAGLAKFYSNGNGARSAMKLVSFTAEAGAFQTLPWQPSNSLSRPSKPGEIVVTSACRSVCTRGIVGLGYVLAETPQGAMLHDASGIFRNVAQADTPVYDRQKLRPRAVWQANSSGQT
jgi:glycine cleavage system aminomethyltransferase T